MRCPFLREAQVKFCRASVYHKMIVRTPGSAENERCSSPDYRSCPAAGQRHEEHPSDSHCPFLQESLVQYCSAAPVTKYIPWSESVTTRCGTTSHRYCDTFLSLAEPEAGAPEPAAPDSGGDREPDRADARVADVRMPPGLGWALNHMWLDESADGACHVGVDMFLTGALGDLQAVSYPSQGGVQRPAAVLRVNGVDFPMIFPMSLLITGVNTKVRTDPGRLLEEPYRQGWLFEGRTGEAGTAGRANGLLRGRRALDWMRQEVERLGRFVHEESAREEQGGRPLLADGGEPAPGVAWTLRRESLLRLFNEFFSPCEGRRGRE